MVEKFIAACLQIKRTMILILLLLLVAGMYAYITIPKESQPDIELATIYVSIAHEGISPEDAERLLIRPMEVELRGIEGVKEMTSVASEGHASVILEFEADVDSDAALADVREKVDLAQAELPQETEEPVVTEISFAQFPVIVVTLSGDLPERTLIDTARDLRDELEGITSVLDVTIGGNREKAVDIVIDPVVAETYDLDQEEIFRLVANNNRLVAAGNLDTGAGRLPVKVPGLYEEAEDILNTPVKVTGDKVIRMRDVATIQQTFKDRESYARVDGRPSVTLEVKKRAGENLIGTIERVKAVVAQERANWPTGIEVGFSGDQSREIRDMLRDLQNNVLSAIILVMIVVVGALGWRTGLLVGVAIPGSFLTGILVLYLNGLTVNIVVLFSLILAVGMLVDGAIVVTEFADRKMTEGVPRQRAYLLASQRMAWPIIASTVTTLAAFAPLLFWPGMVGQFMKFLPITLIATLSASLAMALVFVPVLGSIFGQPGPANAATMRSLAAAEGGDVREVGGFTGWYVRQLESIVKRPFLVFASAVLMLVGSVAIYGVFGRGVEFFPDVEPEQAFVYVRARGDLSIDEFDRLVRAVEERILAMDQSWFRSVYVQTMANAGGGNMMTGSVPEDAHGVIQIEFADWQDRPAGEAILGMIRERTADLAGVLIEVEEPPAGPPVGKKIQVEIASRFPAELEPAMETLREKFENTEGLIDIGDSRPVPGIEWRLEVDRVEASRFGADIASVGNAVRFVTNGLEVGNYRPEDADDEVDIRVRYPIADRSLSEIERLRVRTSAGQVPISNFVRWEVAPKVGEIERKDSRRVLTIGANVEEGINVAAKQSELEEWLRSEQPLSDTISWRFRGEDEEQAESQAFLGNAFLVAMAVMFIILVTQFNSLYQAFLILSAVIFSTVGVFLGLLATHQPFGIVMNGIGVISLAGIVVNNNIVLIDTYNVHRKSGSGCTDAVLRTGAQRLRPVLLTTITTVLGLLPMVLQLNIDFFSFSINHGAPSTQWWVQLATSVVFGLVFATFLTLGVTPSMLVLGERLEHFLAWLRRTLGFHGERRPADSETSPQPEGMQ